MKRFLFAAGAFALVTAAVTFAQDTRPAQPPAAGKAAQPGQGKARPTDFQPDTKSGTWGAITRITPAKMASLEEEFELIEAHRDVRKAHVRAAEVGIKAAESQLELISKAGANIPQNELMKAKLEVDAARAQMEIKIAELKEVEVKVKYAKKRLDDAKAAPIVRPGPGGRPVPVDPPPPAINELPVFDVTLDPTLGAADDMVITELKKKIEELTVAMKTQKETVANADAEVKLAADELAKILDIAMKGRVRPGTIEAAEAKSKEARAALEKAKEKLKETENSLEKTKAKLKELEK